MKVRVEQCWSGGSKYSYRFTIVSGRYAGGRFHITGEEWTRKIATEARDYLQNHYHAKRNSIKWDFL